MSYPKVIKNESVCTYCGYEIKEEFLTVRDNHMIINYFSDEDGEDNVFCSTPCLLDALFVEKVPINEEVE